MKTFGQALIAFVVMFGLPLAIWLHQTSPQKTVGYDCQLAEYPHAIDVPQAYIKACREAKQIQRGNK